MGCRTAPGRHHRAAPLRYAEVAIAEVMVHHEVMDITPETGSLQSVVALLTIGRARDLGILFQPSPTGWSIGYVDGTHGDFLAQDVNLGLAAQQALDELCRKGEAL